MPCGGSCSKGDPPWVRPGGQGSCICDAATCSLRATASCQAASPEQLRCPPASSDALPCVKSAGPSGRGSRNEETKFRRSISATGESRIHRLQLGVRVSPPGRAWNLTIKRVVDFKWSSEFCLSGVCPESFSVGALPPSADAARPKFSVKDALGRIVS